MRTKTLWLWLALLVTSLALVAAGCGGDDTTAATRPEQALRRMREGRKPPTRRSRSTGAPSLRRSTPASASDTTSAAILLNIMDPLVLLDKDNEPQRAWRRAGTSARTARPSRTTFAATASGRTATP